MKILKIETVTYYYYLKNLPLLFIFRNIANHFFFAPQQAPGNTPLRYTGIQVKIIVQEGDILGLSISQLYPCLYSLHARGHLPQGQAGKPAAACPYFQDTQLSIIVEFVHERFCDNALSFQQEEVSSHFFGLPHPAACRIDLALKVQKIFIDG